MKRPVTFQQVQTWVNSQDITVKYVVVENGDNNDDEFCVYEEITKREMVVSWTGQPKETINTLYQSPVSRWMDYDKAKSLSEELSANYAAQKEAA